MAKVEQRTAHDHSRTTDSSSTMDGNDLAALQFINDGSDQILEIFNGW